MTNKAARNKLRNTALVMVVLFLITITGAWAQSLEEQLTWKDYFVAQQFANYPRDPRYDGVMNQIAGRLNGVIVKTFGQDKNITFYVCPSQLGFNAVSFHRFIVFDSLLLDSLRYLAMARVYYGGLDNDYVNQLAGSVTAISQRHRMGYIRWNQNDNENPFGLPRLPARLTPAQQKQAQELFVNMLVSWMAHEGSHCMREHVKYRMQVARRQNQSMDPNSSQQFQNNVNSYMNAKLSQKLEKDADLHATRWLISAGYKVDGFVTWLRFGEQLERKMGTNNAYLRTHPLCSTRIDYIVREARRLGICSGDLPVYRPSAVRPTPAYTPPPPAYTPVPDDDDDQDYNNVGPDSNVQEPVN